ncbi:MAG: DUF2238 domain-containing protein [Gammaproteobacteria bacterium]|nr:DUF2238 domain-containing protein [Gammaproteobacteria bacterium]
MANFRNPDHSRPALGSWLAIFAIVFAWSAINPVDRFTWWLEVLPALLGLAALAFFYPRFRFTSLTAWLILAHCVILIVGGHYTYAEVPLGDWLAELMNSERNNYDKLGHLAQGFVPALIARELFIRLDIVPRAGWRGFLAVCVALAISAFYELIEWWAALLSGEGAEAFLGMQGYTWDTQSDMAWALGGAIAALALLGRLQDRQVDALRIR